MANPSEIIYSAIAGPHCSSLSAEELLYEELLETHCRSTFNAMPFHLSLKK